jgi:hypothetical protein
MLVGLKGRNTLDFTFATTSIRDTCEKARIARRELGVEIAEQLHRALADLHAAETLNDLPMGYSKMDGRTDPPIFLVDLTSRSRLLFSCAHLKPPLKKDGTMELLQITRIKILAVEVTNE